MPSTFLRSLNDLAKLAPSIGQEGVEILRQSLGEVYGELDDQVRREDFRELKEVVLVLAQAQNRTAVRLEELAVRVEELAQAQKRTEVRLEELAEAQKRTEVRLEELAEAQKRTEVRLEELAVRVEELAQAEKRTEVRLEELAAAQTQTEKGLDQLTIRIDQLTARVDQLAYSQSKTEEEIANLTRVVGRVQVELGGLARNAGFLLEDRAYVTLPYLLRRSYGIEVLGPLNRTFVPGTKGRQVEINIWGEGRRLDGKAVRIAGEAKTQLSKKHIGEFDKLLALIAPAAGGQELLPVLVTSQTDPETANEAVRRGWILIYSYDIEEARDERLVERLLKRQPS